MYMYVAGIVLVHVQCMIIILVWWVFVITVHVCTQNSISTNQGRGVAKCVTGNWQVLQLVFYSNLDGLSH